MEGWYWIGSTMDELHKYCFLCTCKSAIEQVTQSLLHAEKGWRRLSTFSNLYFQQLFFICFLLLSSYLGLYVWLVIYKCLFWLKLTKVLRALKILFLRKSWPHLKSSLRSFTCHFFMLVNGFSLSWIPKNLIPSWCNPLNIFFILLAQCVFPWCLVICHKQTIP